MDKSVSEELALVAEWLRWVGQDRLALQVDARVYRDPQVMERVAVDRRLRALDREREELIAQRAELDRQMAEADAVAVEDRT